ncbi:hypothetical protein BC826DRAFT_990234 [Russula brevipes]|nr:hypothetical protein BC826DRAFT_990234 [Russula brevipes]
MTGWPVEIPCDHEHFVQHDLRIHGGPLRSIELRCYFISCQGLVCLLDRSVIKSAGQEHRILPLTYVGMYQHAKRDVHNFSEIRRQSRIIQHEPVRRVAPTYYQTLKSPQSATLVRSQINPEVEVVSRGPELPDSGGCLVAPSDGMRITGLRNLSSHALSRVDEAS